MGLDLLGRQPVLAPAVPTVGGTGGQAVFGPLADKVALELGERGQDDAERYGDTAASWVARSRSATATGRAGSATSSR